LKIRWLFFLTHICKLTELVLTFECQVNKNYQYKLTELVLTFEATNNKAKINSYIIICVSDYLLLNAHEIIMIEDNGGDRIWEVWLGDEQVFHEL
jgi:hypothetical protein